MTLAGSLGSLGERFLSYAFYQHALIAGVAIGIACALLSVFVIQRRMAFIGQGVSHAAFGGVGVALLLELVLPALRHPLLRDAVVALFCVGAALLMGRLGRQRRIGADAGIGIALVVAMALGVLLLDLRAEWARQMAAEGMASSEAWAYAPSFHDILFGNILSIRQTEVWLAGGVATGVLLWVVLLFRGLVFYAADEEAALVSGLPVGLLHYGLLVALAVTIVVAMRLLGVILVSALLILPGVAASFWSRRIRGVMVASVVIAVASVVIGLALAMELRVLSTGPLIVLVLAAGFGVSWALRGRR